MIEIREIRPLAVRHESNAVALHKTHRSDPSGLAICYEFSFEGFLAFRNGSRHQVAAELSVP